MNITVFTSNQPRHLALISQLARISEQVFAIQECNTIFPGEVEDLFHKSPVMQDYFSRVTAAERAVFGSVGFPPANVRSLPIKMGDLSRLDPAALEPAMKSDVFVVFGASFIKGPLCERLIEKRAVNIHMGISPQYRGSSTNFWAMYDDRPQFVGATIHRLSRGLDSGPILFHALPPAQRVEAFELGMLAVKSAQKALADCIARGALFDLPPVGQNRQSELRYTRNADFTDAVAAEYLARLPRADALHAHLLNRDLSTFIRPMIGYD